MPNSLDGKDISDWNSEGWESQHRKDLNHLMDDCKNEDLEKGSYSESDDVISGCQKIRLQDSGHISLFYATCTVVSVTSQEARLAAEDDERTTCKNLQIVSSKECQHSNPRLSHVGTSHPLPPTEDSSVFVTPHILHDDLEGRTQIETCNLRNRPISWWRTHSCQVMERILFSINSPPLQKQVLVFESDPLDLKVVYKYEPQILNSFCADFLGGYKVSGVDQNFALSHIFAVGLYEVKKGAVTIWTLKNMISPERFYRFAASVTCLQFSKQSPNMLAIGFNDGQVIVIDVASTRKKILFRVPYVGSQIVVCLQWWEIGGTEILTFTNGNLVYKVMRPFLTAETKPFIQATYMTAKENIGIRRLSGSFSLTIGPTVRGLWHPSCEPETYLLADAEGEIRVCNIHSSYEFFETYPAHIGVVNAIKPSPFCDQLYLTSGSDGAARIWCLRIQEPLLTLETSLVGADVRDVTWSPCHGTVIVGITAFELCVWDFHRKHHEPISITTLPAPPRCVEFSKDGTFILVGTIAGSVLILGLKDMPFPENYKEISIIYALRSWMKIDAKYDLLEKFMSTIKKPKI